MAEEEHSAIITRGVVEESVSQFKTFLSRNSIIPSGQLPLAHVTQAYFLRRIFQTDSIEPSRCDVFTNEKLAYFFVGRPAYKRTPGTSPSQHWELPACFLVEYQAVGNPRRVFPFDSGAFSSGKRYPPYMSMMDLEDFNAGSDLSAPSKIIGAYFGGTKQYFMGKPKEESVFRDEFQVKALDAEITAVQKLYSGIGLSDSDDRSLSIEVQTDQVITLTGKKLIAAIFPSCYLDNAYLRTHITSDLEAEILTYDIHGFNQAGYTAEIYRHVQDVLTRRNLI